MKDYKFYYLLFTQTQRRKFCCCVCLYKDASIYDSGELPTTAMHGLREIPFIRYSFVRSSYGREIKGTTYFERGIVRAYGVYML